MTLRRYQKALLTATAASGLLVTAACGGSDDGADSASDSSAATEDSGSDDPSQDSSSDGSSSGSYAAGDYEGEGSYSNPSGTSSVTVEMSLADDGTVEDVTVTPEASGTSLQFQEKFAGGIADEIVGMSVDELNVSKVAGSSLTSGGFNEALEQIKADAAA